MEPQNNYYMVTPEPSSNLLANRPLVTTLFVIAYLVIIGSLGYFVAAALNTTAHTGILSVKASDSSAVITISAASREAKVLGTGDATVRLIPGTYYLVASGSGQQTTAVAHITASKTTNINLDLQQSTLAPSPETVTYTNLDSLLNNGITSDQITLIKQYFFTFKPTVHTISIDPASVQPGPHDPNTSIGFTLNFNAMMDSTPYKATLTYPDASSVQLQLFDAQGKLVFDSAQAQ